MPTPDFVLSLREKIGTDLLWLTGVTAVVTRGEGDARELLVVRRADTGSMAGPQLRGGTGDPSS